MSDVWNCGSIRAKNNSEIKIDRVLFNFPDFELLEKYGTRSRYGINIWKNFYDLTDTQFNSCCQCVKAGDIFEFDKIKVNVLRVFNDKITRDFVLIEKEGI